MQTLIHKFKSLPLGARGIIIFFLLPFMIIVIPIYLIWDKTKWNKWLKSTLSIALVAVVLLLIHMPETEQATIPAISPVDSNSSEQISIPPPVSSQSLQEQEMPSQVTQEKPESDNRYIELSQDKDSYLLLLKIIGECYADNSLSQESLEVMQNNSVVAPLVEDILNYKHKTNSLSPDFLESFSLFWNDNLLEQNEEVAQSLRNSFDLEYNALEKNWTLSPIGGNDAQAEWLTASSHLYKGVELYIVTDKTTSLYGFVADINKNKIQVYMEEADKFEWFERLSPLFMEVLKVRSDDPNLPRNQ